MRSKGELDVRGSTGARLRAKLRRKASCAVAERVPALGAAMLDAPVSGSITQVHADTLTIIIGGDKQAYERIADTVS